MKKIKIATTALLKPFEYHSIMRKTLLSMIDKSYNDNLNVRVKINLMEDGMVSKIEYLEPEKLSNTSYRLLAESVSRAIRLCEPLKMPENDYNKWKVTILNFNATDMIGG